MLGRVRAWRTGFWFKCGIQLARRLSKRGTQICYSKITRATFMYHTSATHSHLPAHEPLFEFDLRKRRTQHADALVLASRRLSRRRQTRYCVAFWQSWCIHRTQRRNIAARATRRLKQRALRCAVRYWSCRFVNADRQRHGYLHHRWLLTWHR
eukprot:SAG25_NODE_1295_length_3362_cov_18.009194_1_plen_153_part_00